MKFCIVGTGRSGTGLVRDIFNLHPSVCVANETHWIPTMWEMLGRTRNEFEVYVDIVERTSHVDGSMTLTGILAQVGMSHAQFFSGVRSRLSDATRTDVVEFNSSAYATLADGYGKAFCGDKTADYGAYMSLIQSLWPEVRFINVIRDGRDVAVSMFRHPGFRRMVSLGVSNWVPLSFRGFHQAHGRPSPSLLEFIRLWDRRLRQIMDEASRLRPGSCLGVRYEDLLRHPEEEIRKMADFLKVPLDISWPECAMRIVRSEKLHRPRHKALDEWLTGEAAETLSRFGYC